MRNHHYALGAALLITLAMPCTLAAAADLNAPIDMQAVQLQPQEQNGVRYLQGGIGQDEANALRKTTGYDLHVSFPLARKASSRVVPQSTFRMHKASPYSASRMPGRCCMCSCLPASTKSLAMPKVRRCSNW